MNEVSKKEIISFDKKEIQWMLRGLRSLESSFKRQKTKEGESDIGKILSVWMDEVDTLERKLISKELL